MSASRSRTWISASTGSISPKAGKRMARGLKLARAMYAYDSTSADGKSLSRDEASPRSRGEVPANHLNHPTNQSKRGMYGSVSRGGGAGREGQVGGSHIDTLARKTWPGGGGISAANPKTGNTRMIGRIPRRGGLYGGGGRDTQ